MVPGSGRHTGVQLIDTLHAGKAHEIDAVTIDRIGLPRIWLAGLAMGNRRSETERKGISADVIVYVYAELDGRALCTSASNGQVDSCLPGLSPHCSCSDVSAILSVTLGWVSGEDSQALAALGSANKKP